MSRGSPGRTVSAEVLLATARAILEAVGTPEPSAAAMAASLVESDLVGHESHGPTSSKA